MLAAGMVMTDTDKPRSHKQQRARLAAEWRRAGRTWVEIAEDFRRRYRVNARLAFRMAHDWSQREVADRWNARWPDEPKTFKNVSYWELWPSSTGHQPCLGVLDRLAQLYECSVADLLADLADYRHLDATSPRNQLIHGEPDLPASTPGTAELRWPGGADEEERDAMERRRLLQWAATGLGAGALGLSAEPVRQMLDLALTGDQRSLEDWEIACADHLHAIRTRPPAQVRDDLAVDLLAVQHQLDTTPEGRAAIELRRVTAMLAVLHATALSRLGEHGAAIRWFRTARNAADASGDLDLRLVVRGQEATSGLYGQRDSQTVLRLTHHAQQIAGPRSFGLAKIASTQARALSMLGRHDEARRTLDTVVRLAESNSRWQGPSFWNPAEVHFAESFVHAAGGNEAATDRARDDFVAFPHGCAVDYQYQVNIQLHRALCTVVQGGTEQGVQQAATVLHDLPGTYRTNIITETGRMVLRAVPLDRHERPAVAGLRNALAIAPAP
jgi:transcriptional regulator with XRE-family HTH domain